MSKLTLHGRQVECIFDLLGQNENALTYSLGWILAECHVFLDEFAKILGIREGFSDKINIQLQEYRGEKGFTDLEIVDPSRYHIIIEAKRGFAIPGQDQLEKYANRLIENNDNSAQKLLVILAESDRSEKWLPLQVKSQVKNVPLKTISWHQFNNLAETCVSLGSNSEKRLLRQLISYLGRVSTMQNQNSNLVYVVTLGNWESAVSDISNIDLVEKYKLYFHPVGGSKGGWPVEPPNYIAFRYDGVLKSIHHIENYTVIDDFKDVLEGHAGCGKVEPHYLYKLGEPIRLAKHIPTNDPNKKYPQIVRAARKWCFIDLLLTADSITEAVCKTHERNGSGGHISNSTDDSEDVISVGNK